MNVGVIIIFHNNASDINPKIFIKNIKTTDNLKMCLVDNESKDATLDKLMEIKEACIETVSIVQIKKKVNHEFAKRAGARSMLNDYDLKHIGFIDTNILIEHNYQINDIIGSLCENREDIIKFDELNKSKQRVKSTLLKSVFSILDYFKSQEFSQNNNIQRSIL